MLGKETVGICPWDPGAADAEMGHTENSDQESVIEVCTDEEVWKLSLLRQFGVQYHHELSGFLPHHHTSRHKKKGKSDGSAQVIDTSTCTSSYYHEPQ